MSYLLIFFAVLTMLTVAAIGVLSVWFAISFLLDAKKLGSPNRS
jgi:hypothetical protein